MPLESGLFTTTTQTTQSTGIFTTKALKHEELGGLPQQRESTKVKRPHARKTKKLPDVYPLSAGFR